MNGILSPVLVRTLSVWIAGLLLCMGALTSPIEAVSPESEPTKAASPTLIAQASVAGLSPEDVVRGVTQDVINLFKSDRSLTQRPDPERVMSIVNERVMPVVNFSRMTALSVGRYWNQASAEQKQQLMNAFRELLVLTYSEAVTYAPEATIQVRPGRYLSTDDDVIVRTLLQRPAKEPIPIDYRMQRTASGWKVYDFNVLGLWMVEHYRAQFAQIISARGIDGLIAVLNEKNTSLRQARSAKP
jgi:phospholipid transport system substrate-binding protein